MKELVKRFLKSSKLGKSLYPLVQGVYRLYSIPRKRRLLQKNGLEILKALDTTFNELGVEYFVDYGTLLGVIRDDGFIKSDDDIDVTICNPEIDVRKLVRQFLEKGFEFIHELEYRGRTRLISMSRWGTSIDFYLRELSDDQSEFWMYGVYFDHHITYPSEEWNSCRRVSYPIRMELERYPFKGIQISIPRGAEEHLEYVYGKNWRIPDSKCKGTSDRKVLVMPDFAKRVISLERFLNGN